MPAAVLYVLFLCSGVSGLVYQVIWVREFGNVFGNTISSTSLVVAVFMLGLGTGSYVLGRWADRRYASAPESLLSAYGFVELFIAALGVTIALVLPRLGSLAAVLSSYEPGAHGWFVLTPMSYVARGAIAIALLTPSTVLMGGTLTLLIRHLVRQDVETIGGWTIAVLYGVNTAGAAMGAFLTDFVLVPAFGLFATQLGAVALNVVAGAGALLLARRLPSAVARPTQARAEAPARTSSTTGTTATVCTSLALALSGCSAMGLEILWLRHFNLLLGGFRAVFSLLLTIMLVGIGAGSVIGGVLSRRTTRPAQALMLIQALLVVSALVGLGAASLSAVQIEGRSLEIAMTSWPAWARALTEVWYNVRPMLLEAGLPALFMGCAYPLGNAVVQHTERAVGGRAGVLYLANTAGGVVGSLVTGFVLLPTLGIQGSATWIMAAGALSMAPLYLAMRAATTSAPAGGPRRGKPPLRPLRASAVRPVMAIAAAGIAAAAIAFWMTLPADYVVQRSIALEKQGEHLVAVSEGVSELIAVTEVTGRGRALMTNGHPMSSTAILDQRYMRALAHIPLLAMDHPRRVLVIGFGVGNTTQAATLHPSVDRVEVADLSRHVLEQADYFRDANRGILNDPRVSVYINDGRQHLRMQPEGTYDLITLEPPPLAQVGVAALYSREFYALARSRLKPGGYLSQWLPAYQVPPETSLAMVRAFSDVFPQSVLLSGTQAELLLLGTTGPTIQIDPSRLADALRRAPDVQADLHRIDLGTVTEIVGTFVGGAQTMTLATRESTAVKDDRPLQEYDVRSVLGSGPSGVPASLFNLGELGAWCPRCYSGDRPAPEVPGLDTYMALLDRSYNARAADVIAAASGGQRRILGSAYLGAIVPDTAEVHTILGLAALREGRRDDAMVEFRYAVQLDPRDADAEYELGSALLERRQWADAADHLRAAIRLQPNSAAAHNDLGAALASIGDISGALGQFNQAIALEPNFAAARQNLASAERARAARSQ